MFEWLKIWKKKDAVSVRCSELLCFLGIHKRTVTDEWRGPAGGIHCTKCEKVLMKPIKWPKPPPRSKIKDIEA